MAYGAVAGTNIQMGSSPTIWKTCLPILVKSGRSLEFVFLQYFPFFSSYLSDDMNVVCKS